MCEEMFGGVQFRVGLEAKSQPIDQVLTKLTAFGYMFADLIVWLFHKMQNKLLLLIIIDAAALPEKGSALVLHFIQCPFPNQIWFGLWEKLQNIRSIPNQIEFSLE